MEDYKQVLIDLIEFISDRVKDNGTDAVNLGESVMDIEHVSEGELATKKEIVKKMTIENETYNEVMNFISERVEL